MVQITQIPVNGEWEAHKAGCADLTKKGRKQFTGEAWTAEFDTQWEMALDHCSDFIAEGSMRAEDAMSEIRIMPCAARILPVGEAPTEPAPISGSQAPEPFAEPIGPLTAFEAVVAASRAANARVFG